MLRWRICANVTITFAMITQSDLDNLKPGEKLELYSPSTKHRWIPDGLKFVRFIVDTPHETIAELRDHNGRIYRIRHTVGTIS